MELPFDTNENKPVLLLSEQLCPHFSMCPASFLKGKSVSISFQSDVTEAKYFATPLVLGPNGVEKNLGLGTLTAFEQVINDWLYFIASHIYHFLK